MEVEKKVNHKQIIQDDKLEKLMGELNIQDINKTNGEIDTFDYSKILYYSLVFDNEVYEKILELVFQNTKITGIYNYTKDKQIVSVKTKCSRSSSSIPEIPDIKTEFSKQIEKLTLGDNFAIKLSSFDDNKQIGINPNPNINILYKLNEKFHTTMLYLDGKKDSKALELEPYVDSQVVVLVKTVGISDKFIVCGIEIKDKAIPYYGNPIQHITVGLRKTESNKFKLFPKDSPTAFDEGIKIILENPIEITGKIIKELKTTKPTQK